MFKALKRDRAFYGYLLRLTGPIALQNLITFSLGLIDTLMVSQLGNNEMAAVTAANVPVFLLISIVFGVQSGVGILISQYWGKKDLPSISRAIGVAAGLGVALALVIALALFLWPVQIMDLMSNKHHLSLLGAPYLRVIGFSYVFNMLSSIYVSAQRSVENASFGMKLFGMSTVLNTGMNYLLIFGKCGFPMLGVEGAAIATDISQLVSCVLSLRFLIKSTDDCRVIPREIRLHKKMAARIIRVGLPTGIQNMVISFSNVLVQASVNSYGAAAMAGFAAYMKIDGFNILPVSSISMAATTFVGQNYGAGRLDRVKKGTWVTLAVGVVYTLITGTLLLLGQNAILHLFTQDEAVVAFGAAAMHWFCPFYFLLSILHGLAGAVRGTGASIPPMVVLLVSLCLFRIVWIQWVLPLFSGIEGVFILYPVSWALGAGLMILYAWKGKWMEYHA